MDQESNKGKMLQKLFNNYSLLQYLLYDTICFLKIYLFFIYLFKVSYSNILFSQIHNESIHSLKKKDIEFQKQIKIISRIDDL